MALPPPKKKITSLSQEKLDELIGKFAGISQTAPARLDMHNFLHAMLDAGVKEVGGMQILSRYYVHGNGGTYAHHFVPFDRYMTDTKDKDPDIPRIMLDPEWHEAMDGYGPSFSAALGWFKANEAWIHADEATRARWKWNMNFVHDEIEDDRPLKASKEALDVIAKKLGFNMTTTEFLTKLEECSDQCQPLLKYKSTDKDLLTEEDCMRAWSCFVIVKKKVPFSTIAFAEPEAASS